MVKGHRLNRSDPGRWFNRNSVESDKSVSGVAGTNTRQSIDKFIRSCSLADERMIVRRRRTHPNVFAKCIEIQHGVDQPTARIEAVVQGGKEPIFV